MLSMMQIQSFIGEVSNMVNSKDNPLGLQPGQIDEINQIMNIIKNILSDGIQRGDISKLIHLLGEMAEHMPEISDEVKEIIKDLKKLEKKLFGDQNEFMNVDKVQSTGIADTDAMLMQEVGERGLLTNDLDSLMDVDSVSEDDIAEGVLADSFEARSQIAVNILNMFNNRLILSTDNFNSIEKLLNKIERQANVKPSKFTAIEATETDSSRNDVKVKPVEDFNESVQQTDNSSIANDYITGNSSSIDVGA